MNNFRFADCHSCLPVRPDADINMLKLHYEAGCRYVSINVGMDLQPVSQIFSTIASFRRQISESDFLIQAENFSDIERAFREEKLAVSFDLEGSLPLLDNKDTLALYKKLGLRQIHLAYNRNNSIAGGAHDPVKQGLTKFGEEIVREIHRLGILMDLSHSSEETARDICALSRTLNKPVLYSHANPRAIVKHERNISDEIIQEVAKTGGIIAINGVAKFVGSSDLNPLAMIPHIEHCAALVGTDKVAIGLDYCYDDGISDIPSDCNRGFWWPIQSGYGENGLGGKYISPENLCKICEELARLNYQEDEIAAICSKNLLVLIDKSWY